jgi:hypothetical protein
VLQTWADTHPELAPWCLFAWQMPVNVARRPASLTAVVVEVEESAVTAAAASAAAVAK